MTTLSFHIDIDADIKNWHDCAHKSNYGVNWNKHIPADILSQLMGTTLDQASIILKPIIQQLYEQYDTSAYVQELNTRRETQSPEIFSRMERIVGKSLPVSHIQGQITTVGRCPYNPTNRSFMYSTHRNGQKKPLEESMRVAIHETLHMMMHYYYEEYVMSQGLHREQFHEIKEAQTVILSHEYGDISPYPDNGYEIHADLRKHFAEFRSHTPNFQKFVEYGIETARRQKIFIDLL